MHKLCYYPNITRQWFINNHPLVQKWEAEGIQWHLHHWDTQLKYINRKRYDMYMIEDVIPVTASWHTRMHKTGKKFTPEHCKKIGDKSRGRHPTEKSKEKNRQAHLGKHLTPEAKQKISDVNKGKFVSEATRKKLHDSQSGTKNSFYGKHHTEEVKQKIREANSGANNVTSRKVLCVELDITFNTVTEAKKFIGKGDIFYAIRHNSRAGGYHWKYVD